MGIRKLLRIRNRVAREMLAEFIGTFILVALIVVLSLFIFRWHFIAEQSFAIASGAQYVLSRHELSSFLTVNFAGGMGLTFGIYWAGGASGASLNPAVTLAFCLHGILEWWQYAHYAVAEMLGAFVAAAVQFGVFYDGINAYDGGTRATHGENATAGIFATFPNENVSTLNCYFDQVFGTFILISCILAVTDNRNMKPHKGLMPLALGGIVFAIGTCWAYNCGYAINPARDLGPRIFTAIAGWGVEPFSYRDYNWFWVPIVGPMSGAIVAWIVYNIFINLHWPDDEEEAELNQVLSVSPPGEKSENGDIKTGVVNPAYTGDQSLSINSDQKTKL